MMKDKIKVIPKGKKPLLFVIDKKEWRFVPGKPQEITTKLYNKLKKYLKREVKK